MNGRNIVLVATSFLTILIGGGTVLFHSLEKWTWIESFYFTVATITTVGYGDIAPSNDTTRLVTSLYIIFGVAIGAGIIRYLVGAMVKSGASRRLARRQHKKSD